MKKAVVTGVFVILFIIGVFVFNDKPEEPEINYEAIFNNTVSQKEKADKINEVKDTFFNNLFSDFYSKSKLKIRYGEKEPLNFWLDSSYFIKNSDISSKCAERSNELIGGNIFYPVKGDLVVLYFQSLDMGISSRIDDETHYSLLIAIPDLNIGSYQINKDHNTKAKLGYYHYGVSGHVIESRSATGMISITKQEERSIRGILNVKFYSDEDGDIIIAGDFQLPLADKKHLFVLEQEIKKITDE